MENDSIRAHGTDTLVDIWVNGKMRAITISHEAIGAFLGFERASNMREDDRCEFVRTHLPLIVTAAKEQLRDSDLEAASVVLNPGELPRSDGKSGERRAVDRRKGDRRKQSKLPPGQPERRRGDRRTGERRTRPKTP